MQRIFYTLVLVMGITFVHAFPKPVIPQNVHSYINQHYPNAKRVHYLVHEGQYIVSLWTSNIHIQICLNESGEFENSVKEVLFYEELPSKITSSVDMKNLAYVEKLESKNGDIFYILQLYLPKGKIEEMVFDASGTKIKDYIVADDTDDNKDDVIEF